MPLGRPITLSSNVASKSLSITATAGQTVFLPSGGYRINEIAVYKEGVRLVDGTDFTARDGASVILTSGASLNDVLEFQIFDSFNIANTIKPNESTQTITGSLVVEGGITGSVLGIQSGGTAIGTGRTVNFIGTGNTVVDNGDGIINVSISGETAGIDTSTTSEFTDISVSGVATVGSAVTINSTGIDAVSGVITAANFVGGGANLTALNGTNIASGTVAAARVATLNQNTSGTAANLSGTPDITINNITGVAATFTGVLTYEDVTNVDSVGIVTARSGIEFGAAGVGGTVTAVGHAEFVGIVTVTQGTDLDGYKVEEGSYDTDALNGEFDFELENGHVQTHTGSTAGTYFPDFRVSSSQSLSSVMDVGDVVTATLIVTASNASHYCTAGIKIDNSTSNVTVEWIGSSAASAGKGAGYDIYTFTIQKTAATPAYLVIVNATDAG